MSLIHGSRGLIYFVHQFKPSFREAALLDDSEMLEGITALNRQITRLAPVLNGPSVNDAITLRPENSTVPVAFTVRHHEGATWIFAVSMREGETTAEFSLKDEIDSKSVEVLDEDRSIPIQARGFKDRFGSWDVHLYRLK